MYPRVALWMIIILTVVSVWVNIPAIENLPDKLTIFGQEINFLSPKQIFGSFPIKLGLDLQGGTEVLLQTQMDNITPENRDSALESARQVIEKRVNFFGVSEAVVQSSKVGEDRRILVELPGIKDTDKAIELVGRTAQLEFREIATYSAESTGSGLISKFNTSATGLTGADLKKSQVEFGSGSGIQSSAIVGIEFTPSGAEKFAEVTRRNVGKPLVIFLDDFPVSAPVVRQEILGGKAVIEGNFTTDEAKNLVIQLNAGALPVPIKVLSHRLIGASLGNESVQKSLMAGVIGIVTVMVYMVAFYGVYGLIADIALLLYALAVLAVFRTGLFLLPQVTLTLAGIAGFILSVGMAVDANILTFERMKEELREGRGMREALEHGFKRSWTSIRDSNTSSLITAAILYFFGTSVVKGFALTLAIGVLMSMFSAVIVTRTLLRLLPRFR